MDRIEEVKDRKTRKVIGYKSRAYLGRGENGKIRKSPLVYADTKAELKRKIKELEAKGLGDVKGKLNFDKAADKFIEGKKKEKLSPNTVQIYISAKTRIKKHSSWFMSKTLDEISKDDMRDLLFELSEVYSRNSIVTTMTLISGTFHEFDMNPPDFKVPGEVEEPDIRVPTQEEVTKLLEIAKDTSLWAGIYMYAYGPLRRGEICALTPEDVILTPDGKTLVTVNKNMVIDLDGNYIIKSPKTKQSNRKVEFPRELYDWVQEHGAVCNIKPNCFTQELRTLLKNNNMELFTLHSLRHFAVSWFYSMKVPDKVVMERGGWKNSSIMDKYYKTVLPDLRERETAKIFDAINERSA